jgi:hypothetical protein
MAFVQPEKRWNRPWKLVNRLIQCDKIANTFSFGMIKITGFLILVNTTWRRTEAQLAGLCPESENLSGLPGQDLAQSPG